MEELFLKWLVPFVCGSAISLISALIAMWRQGHKKERSIERGLQCLLRAEIIRSFDKYSDKHYCPIYAKEALKREYDSYHNLGGNDVATGLYKKIMELPEEPDKL